jgi:hypothetical protein
VSVTFSIDSNGAITGYAVACYAYGAEAGFRGPLADTREAALAQHAAAHTGIDDCDGQYALPVEPFDDADVNMSNRNAAMVLDALGLPSSFDDGLAGSEDADAFLGRILLAIAMCPDDPGVPVHQMTAAETQADPTVGFIAGALGGARVVDCGRPAGYLQDRLADLRTLAETARAHGHGVYWG